MPAIRSARKTAGLNKGFPNSDPLMMAFGDFLHIFGAAMKNIASCKKRHNAFDSGCRRAQCIIRKLVTGRQFVCQLLNSRLKKQY